MGSNADLINQFMLYTEGYPSCDLYRKWSAITMVAGAMERRIHTIAATQVNWPNLYVMFLGPPGSGKSIIDVVGGLWSLTKDEYGAPAFFSGVDDATKAALVDALKAAQRVHGPTNYLYHNLLLPIEEFSVTFSKFEAETLAFLTRVWNGPLHYKEQRRKSGTNTITAPLITGLFGYQPELMNKILIQGAGEQGFLRRTILIWNERADEKPLFDVPPLSENLRNQICSRLSEIALLYGEMQWDSDAKTLLARWRAEGQYPRPEHHNLQYYNLTRVQFIIKLSMVASMSESNNMAVHLNHVERAFDWLLEAERLMPDIFDYMKGDSDSRTVKALYSAMLKQATLGKPITNEFLYSWLGEHAYASKHEQLISLMEKSGTIMRKPDNTWRVTGKEP